jgi:hypothetical protein
VGSAVLRVSTVRPGAFNTTRFIHVVVITEVNLNFSRDFLHHTKAYRWLLVTRILFHHLYSCFIFILSLLSLYVPYFSLQMKNQVNFEYALKLRKQLSIQFSKYFSLANVLEGQFHLKGKICLHSIQYSFAYSF